MICAPVGAGALGFLRGSRDKILGVSDLARVSSSVIGAVRACLLARLLRRVAPRFSCPGLFVGLALARARCAIAGGSAWLLAVTSRACHLGSQCAVRLFRWMGVWGVLVGLIKFSGFLFGLRPVHRPRPPAPSTGPVHRPRPTPRPPLHPPAAGPADATTPPETRGRCPGSFRSSPTYNTHSKPRSFWLLVVPSCSCCICCASPLLVTKRHFLPPRYAGGRKRFQSNLGRGPATSILLSSAGRRRRPACNDSEVDNAVEAAKRRQTTDSHSHSQPQPLTAEVMSYYADSVMLFVLAATPIRWGDSGPLERARSGFSSPVASHALFVG